MKFNNEKNETNNKNSQKSYISKLCIGDWKDM